MNLSTRIAVLIPCYNEEVAIPKVVADFQQALPQASIHVFDNNSSDSTAQVAKSAGALVRSSTRQGKGNVIRHMFSDIEADVYVLVDGDATYDAASAPTMVRKLLDEQLDMVVGKRISTAIEAYRVGHQFGNRMLTGCVALLFGRQFTDILSGYRVFSRRYVKSFPALATGFETETELTVHALELRMPIDEVDTPYGARPEGSVSKLSTYKDGFRILGTIAKLFRLERPLWFFNCLALLLLTVAVLMGIPLVATYLETGLVPRIPTVVLIIGLGLTSLQFFLSGLVLDAITHGRREAKRLVYLGYPAPVPHPNI